MPSPSVMLCTMKPTIRNVPSASSPSAIDEPIASPSPRLCSPIPIAISVAERHALERRAPLALAAPEQALGDERQPEVARRDAEQDQPGPLEAARKRRLELERLARARRGRGSSASPAVSAMNAASQRGAGASAATGSQARPSATGTIPTSNPISA